MVPQPAEFFTKVGKEWTNISYKLDDSDDEASAADEDEEGDDSEQENKSKSKKKVTSEHQLSIHVKKMRPCVASGHLSYLFLCMSAVRNPSGHNESCPAESCREINVLHSPDSTLVLFLHRPKLHQD